MSYIYIWKFEVKQGKETEFEQIYGADGDWVRLFLRGKGYVRTMLVRDIAEKNIYLTVDEWETADSFRKFQKEYRESYSELDQKCSSLTIHESQIGEYERI